MNNLVTEKGVSACLIISFLFMILLSPGLSLAGWDDKSDELPGMTDDSEMLTYVLIAAGAVLAIYLVVKLSDTEEPEKDEAKDEIKKEAGSDSTSTAFNQSSFNHHFVLDKKYQMSNPFQEEVSVMPILGLKSNHNTRVGVKTTNVFENQIFVMGVTVRF